jgi:hypothetical protein
LLSNVATVGVNALLLPAPSATQQLEPTERPSVPAAICESSVSARLVGVPPVLPTALKVPPEVTV